MTDSSEHDVAITSADVAPPPAAERTSLFHAIRRGDAGAVSYYLAQGIDPNVQDADGMTNLHLAAALGARGCILSLISSGRCDYLIRDAQGRYASDLASEWARDRPLARLLRSKQRQQAETQSRPAWVGS